MENLQTSSSLISSCHGPLPDLEVPMINSMVSCLGFEHRKLDKHTLQLALAATRLAEKPNSSDAHTRAVEAWDDIRGYLWPHLQIEDELVLWSGGTGHAIPDPTPQPLNSDRDEMRKLLAFVALNARKDGQTADERQIFAQTLLALTKLLDSHVERYDAQVLPAILRAAFRR